MLSSARGGSGHRRMPVVGSGNDHGIDLLVGKEFLMGPIAAGDLAGGRQTQSA